KLLHTRLDQHLDALYSAHDFGQPKEQPTLWQSLQQVTPFDPARTLLIDDNESVLRSTQQFSIRHLITIAQPDSQQPPRDGLAFPAIEQFSALW
ncbi:MAG TPA: haloacid dehalogenase, partial [Pseudomonadales bacterium]|nr:haloacid dehalogenase [Pseudomonadales bacterium]